ncbi:hypothetical protein [Nocardia sp. NPDC004860]|uniref:hypothetical protein n=1 Tax=Nocardia sp. NPDC004860 TaxID=3154557 RepID=UPI0033B42E74
MGGDLRRAFVSPRRPVSQRLKDTHSYTTTANGRMTDEQTWDRIRALAIPPARSRVWICPYPTGHIPAVGRDAAGGHRFRGTHRTRHLFEVAHRVLATQPRNHTTMW